MKFMTTDPPMLWALVYATECNSIPIILQLVKDNQFWVQDEMGVFEER